MSAAAVDPTTARRAEMLQVIEAEAKATAMHTGRSVFAPRVLDALAEVPRHRFVRDDDHNRAYANVPLPIGQGQTISQPFIVALMTDLLDLKGNERVLELGTGSGYQTAVLAELCAQVYTIEVVAALAQRAAERFEALQLHNITVRTGDGSLGWPDHAPFQAILVTAATPAVPQVLVDQLAAPGRMVVPVGKAGAVQELTLVTKDAAGAVGIRSVLPVAFVPLVHATP
jgi:protein-L-isoaspartate(D-aspartate) O-methyltransferase